MTDEKQGLDSECEAWTKANPVGTKVLYWPGVRAGQGLESETTSAGWILGGHTVGVFVRGCGFVALSHVELLARASEGGAP